jgi:hypothetical protein
MNKGKNNCHILTFILTFRLKNNCSAESPLISMVLEDGAGEGNRTLV